MAKALEPSAMKYELMVLDEGLLFGLLDHVQVAMEWDKGRYPAIWEKDEAVSSGSMQRSLFALHHTMHTDTIEGCTAMHVRSMVWKEVADDAVDSGSPFLHHVHENTHVSKLLRKVGLHAAGASRRKVVTRGSQEEIGLILELFRDYLTLGFDIYPNFVKRYSDFTYTAAAHLHAGGVVLLSIVRPNTPDLWLAIAPEGYMINAKQELPENYKVGNKDIGCPEYVNWMSLLG